MAGGVSTTAAEAAKKPTAKSVDKRVDKTNKSLAKVKKNGAATKTQLDKATKDIGAATARLTTAEGNLGVILGAAPQLASGLTQLGDAVKNQIAPGLLALQSALTDKVQPALTQLGDGLTTLGSAYKAVEYGRAATYATLNGATTQLAPTAGENGVTSSDIPDDSNAATVSGDTYYTLANNDVLTLDLRAEILSAESDTATTEAAGLAGGVLTVTGPDGVPVNCGASTIAQTPQVVQFGGLRLKPVVGVNRRAEAPGTPIFPANSTAGQSLLNTTCNVTAPAAGAGIYKVHYQADFRDFPSSATNPSPTE